MSNVEKFEGKPGNDFPAKIDNGSVRQDKNSFKYSTERKYRIDVSATRYMDHNEEVFYEALLSSARSLEEIQEQMEKMTNAIMKLSQVIEETSSISQREAG